MKEFIDKLIARLEELKDTDVCSYSACTHEECADCVQFSIPQRAIEIVNELAEEYKGDWIPCSERLPKYLENVLVCTETGLVTIAYMQGEIYGNSWADGLGLISKVIAWQPLPARYTEGE